MTMQWFLIYFIVGINHIGSFVQPANLPSIPDDDGRIVGGENADINDIPYQLSVQILGWQHQCGASIVGAYWAVSAAHCFENRYPGTVLVAGTSHHKHGGQKHEVEMIISHPQYNPITMDNDIAVIKVKKPFNLGSSGINCIRLASQEIAQGTDAQTSGWGYLQANGDMPDQLQTVVVPIISNTKCNQAYGGKITENMICAGHQQGGKDACQGDSGGPLTAQDELIGVVSFGIGCAKPGIPGVYANVNKLRNWVESVTGKLNC